MSAWLSAAILASCLLAPEHAAAGSDGTSRSCLTSSARGLLARIEDKFGSVKIISTCRPGAKIAGTGRPSRHASGNAVDFDAGSRKGRIVRWLVANHRSGGTMTYSGMNHIHVDIGPHFVSLAEAPLSNTSSPTWPPMPPRAAADKDASRHASNE
jgi:hypothetical protein